LDNKVINEFELILNELTSKDDGTLSFKDLSIALFLMKVFVVYPKNYGGLVFDDPLLELHIKNKERSLLLQVWNLIQPGIYPARKRMPRQLCIGFLLSLFDPRLSNEDYDVILEWHTQQLQRSGFLG